MFWCRDMTYSYIQEAARVFLVVARVFGWLLGNCYDVLAGS